jgi:hypothetical protein
VKTGQPSVRTVVRTVVRAAARAALLVLIAVPAAAASDPQPTPAETILEGWVYPIETSPIIRGETPPPGTIVTRMQIGPRWRFSRVDAYLHTELDADVLYEARGRWCLLRGVLHDDGIAVGGGAFPRRAFDVLDVTAIRAFDDPFALRPAVRGAIQRDLFARGVDYARDGTPTPVDGPDANGRLPDGRRARRVPLVTPPADSADMYSETAFVDARTHTYWAVREGGFMAVVQWVGPFELPRGKAAPPRGARGR